MRQLLAIIIIIVSALKAISQPISTANLKDYDGQDINIPSQNGGHFIASFEKLKEDGGVVFAKKNGGYWVRDYDTRQGVNPCWWGAKGDGVTDCLPALKLATAFALANKVDIVFPSGVFRITDTWLIGYKFLSEADMWNHQFQTAPSYDKNAYADSRFCENISISGSSNTNIWGDFKSDTDKAIVYYALIGGGNSSKRCLQSSRHSFKNITITGQPTFTKNVFSNLYKPNKQIGLCVPRTPSFYMDGVTFVGVNVGLYGQDLYASSITNSTADGCNYGMILIAHNATLLNTISFNNCLTGLFLSGSSVVINNIWCNNCPTGLKLGGKSIVDYDYGCGSVVINGAYLENDIVHLYPNIGQIIIGGDSDNKKTEVNSVYINGLTGATNGRQFLVLKNCTGVTLETPSISGEAILSSFPKNKLIVSNPNRPPKFSGKGTVLTH